VINNKGQQAGPISQKDRIESIDILRGIALFGVMTVNLVTEFRVSIFEQFVSPTPSSGSLDHALQGFVLNVLQGKAIVLFSFLFGVGIAIQHEHLSHLDSRARLLVRRFLSLLAFGLLHALLVWNGDILVHYALVALIVLPLLGMPTPVLAALTVLLFSVHIGFSPLASSWILQPPTLHAHIDEANRVSAIGGFVENRQFSLNEITYLIPLHATIVFRTASLFLVGVLAWRHRIIQGPKRTWLIGLILGGIGLRYAAIAMTRNEGIATLSPIMVSLAFGASVILIADSPYVRRAVSWAGYIGRMTFTNYVLQSITFGLIFYGYGLGLFNSLDSIQAMVIGIIVYALQAIGSVFWLRRNRFGPLESIWRRMMYGAN
jgi:uncharacterized protein